MELLIRFTHSLFHKREMSTTRLVIFTALFFVIFDNEKFFQNVLVVYPLSFANIGFLASLAIGMTALIVFLISLLSSRYTTKPVLVILLIFSSFTAYFMDSYNVVIDDIMIQNMVETNWEETADLLSFKILYYVLFLGALPSLFVYRIKLINYPLKKGVIQNIRNSVISIILVFATVLFFSKFYTSFFRENKPLRYYANPIYYIYSVGKYLNGTSNTHKTTVFPLGRDAQVVESDGDGNDDHKKLVILIVGEAARADHFSLNGYKRDTNPYSKQEKIINFNNMYSCGTSTAYSVPCMFSNFPRNDFSIAKSKETENVLDVLRHTGLIDILWRDNNSDSKGVALRVAYEDYRKPAKNTMCSDVECRDEGMIVGLDQYISQHKKRDILIVLHQMGNHGPAYYKRYPEEFEKFTPACKTNQIEKCSNEEVINAYDNALLYTDYFLSKVIKFLERYDTTHDTAMMYLSDHGESLGERGIYLHGLPYSMAPESQKHVGSIMWFGEETGKKIDLEKVRENKDKRYSHDNLFHILLGLFEVETEVYKKKMDIINN